MSSIKFSAGGGRWPVKDGTLAVGIVADMDGATKTDTVSFSVPNDFHAHPDCVAGALSTLAGRKYSRIAFDFPISLNAKEMISSTYKVDVTFDGVARPPRVPGKATALNFSGGFDSLAAKLLAGDDIKLISMAFGGYFTREETYFQTFDTVVCRTDFRSKGYHLNDWRFMGAGSLLLADYLDLGTVAFGTNFESTPWNYGPPKTPPRLNGPFGAAGTLNISWISGITEFGTSMVVLAYAPEAVKPALQSLADPGSQKYFRKQILIQLAAERLKIPHDIGELKLPKDKRVFGTGFLDDLLVPLILQRFGRDFMNRALDKLPDDDLVKDIVASDLSFYYKLNPNHLADIPPAMRPTVLSRAFGAGLEPFNETDFVSYRKVRSLLERYHKFPV